MSTQVAADLRAAADVLRRDGWGQGSFHLPSGCHCADGALALATGAHVSVEFDQAGEQVITESEQRVSHRRWQAAFEHLGDYLRSQRATPYGSPISWNDHEGRTADEVIAALEAAADTAEATA